MIAYGRPQLQLDLGLRSILSQTRQVNLVGIPVSNFLILNQVLKGDDGNWNVTEVSLDPVRPCLTEGYSINGCHDIDTCGSHTELKNDLLLRQVVNREIGHWSAKLDQRGVSSLGIFRIRVNPDVHVLCVKGFSVLHDGIAANDEVGDLVTIEKSQ